MSTIWLKKIIQEKTIVEVQSHQRHRNLTTYDILSIRSRQKLVTTEHLIFTHHPQLSNHSKRYTLKAQPWTKHHSTGRKTETLAVVFLRNICLISLSLHRPSFSTATTATDSIQRLSTTDAPLWSTGRIPPLTLPHHEVHQNNRMPKLHRHAAILTPRRPVLQSPRLSQSPARSPKPPPDLLCLILCAA